MRNVATQSWRRIQKFAHHVFEVATHFVNARNALNPTIRAIHPLNDFIEHAADLFDHALIGFVVFVDRDNFLSRRIENDVAERNPS